MRRIDRLLVANRGEIARRVFRTCRDLGITTVAVHSDPDAAAPHVADADLAVRLPGATAEETYLRRDRLVAAALAASADAVHPGYGFLSEDAELARMVRDVGLTWVGPPSEVIDAMASKVAAKRTVAAAGVPVLDTLDPAEVTGEHLPVLLKASAGGGGKGMRVVHDLAALPAAVAAARAEAAAAFGDDTVFCEPYLAAGRHIEVQVLADGSGAVWTLGERECSIQRRHQKFVEETPSPLADLPDGEGLRTQLQDAAASVVKAIGYLGAGTVEFLVAAGAAERRFCFLEMNTRLQVEHPVTECVTGLDLVAWQIRIAEGASLPAEPPASRGHAVEARLYAEDPAAGWQPQAGTVHRLTVPGVDAEFRVPPRYGVRLDSGVSDGTVIGVHYDPLLAKVVSWAPTRTEAVRRLATVLAGTRIHGVTTNRDLLVRVLRHPAFLAGDTDTGFMERHGTAALAAPLADDACVRLSALAAALAGAAANREASTVLRHVPSGWRNVPSQPQQAAYRTVDAALEVRYRLTRDGLLADGYDDVRLVSATSERVVLDVAGVASVFDVARYPDLVCVDSVRGPVVLHPVPRFPEPASRVPAGSLVAPLPGTVTAVHVAEGDRVAAGSPLLVLEAMKMQYPVSATDAGVVTSVPVGVGVTVDAGAVLAVVEPERSVDGLP